MTPQPPVPAPASRRRQRSKAAARLTGRADDETEDNAVSPFDTAEIPVPHSREYERAEDAPAIRTLLAKKRARAGIACIVSGAMSLVMIVLALLPVRPRRPERPHGLPVGAARAAAGQLRRQLADFLDGFKGLGKTPSPDSLSILPALGAAVQCLAVLATGGYTDGTLMLAGPAALMLCMNAAGHALNAATVCDAFESVSGQDGYAVAYRLKDAGALRAISQGLSEPHPCVLVTRPTQIFRSFRPTVPPTAPAIRTSSSLSGCWAAADWRPSCSRLSRPKAQPRRPRP